MLTAGEIASMRGTAARALPDLATIQRKTGTSDGAGGWDETWLPIANNVACRIDPLQGGEPIRPGSRGTNLGDRAVDETTHIVTFHSAQEITEADRIVIDGQVHEVTLVRTRSAWELTRRVEVKEAP